MFYYRPVKGNPGNSTRAVTMKILVLLGSLGLVGCLVAFSHRITSASIKQVQDDADSVKSSMEGLRRDAEQLDANLRTIHEDLKKAVGAQREDRNQVMSLTDSLGGLDLAQLNKKLTSLQEEATRKFSLLEREIAQTREQSRSFVNEVSNGKVDHMRLVEDRNDLEGRLAAAEKRLADRLTALEELEKSRHNPKDVQEASLLKQQIQAQDARIKTLLAESAHPVRAPGLLL
ncbi:hypothetical protein Pmar_PMAR008721 [Perkinsus marinus ATCC 50983]|uniref:Chromosome partition protein Smc n=1 Tax=Perkinsus marinus (strain ATCC 50983 / TXsc) TaxID=423536 RepID=C5L0T9_PERM5|nr:hypothetical protein Pmar_PMAR008721 [Perkinsus marinus ATCC 50983]EER09581.1 hypothetical protein Pmar_PMAR008721 [Perkinsus marinus ATCC 50983]|eukprot:XP_002777786.1 hypothetical protein Pmar_PMAR008721 [Perkinsus marinus ATCC 50983]